MTDHPDDMKPLTVQIPGQKTNASLQTFSQKPNAARMEKAIATYRMLMRGRPDYGKESPDYAVGMTETLSYLTDEELAWLTHPREGLHTVGEYSKFLPQPCDVHDFLRAKRARMEAVRPARTVYKRLNDDPGPWDQETDYERKARLVQELLGYNPSPKAQQTEAKRNLVPPTLEDMRNLKLKTPPAPPSAYLLAQLEAEGWPFIPSKDEAA